MSRTRALRIAVVVFICAVLAGALYFTPKPGPASEKAFTLELAGNALASGPSVMTVNQGDTVTLRLKADRGGRLMIHGYEKELTVGGRAETRLTFVADKSGRFFIHLHRGEEHIEIAAIEVQPR